MLNAQLIQVFRYYKTQGYDLIMALGLRSHELMIKRIILQIPLWIRGQVGEGDKLDIQHVPPSKEPF